jgi:hypothetical protein
MNRENIVRMAIDAGWDAHHAEFDTRIQTFAVFVASAVREEDRENALAYMRMLHDSFSLASKPIEGGKHDAS